MCVSVGSRTSAIRTIDVTDSEPSLVASLIMCECGSMIPGIRYWPVASIVVAPAGARSPVPIAAIFPPCSRTSVSVSVPLVTVSTVAWVISVGGAGAWAATPLATTSEATSVASVFMESSRVAMSAGRMIVVVGAGRPVVLGRGRGATGGLRGRRRGRGDLVALAIDEDLAHLAAGLEEVTGDQRQVGDL